MNCKETEKYIIANKGNAEIINSLLNEIDKRMNEIDYIMDRFLEDYPESEDPQIVSFHEAHNAEYYDVSRLKRIANAYI